MSILTIAWTTCGAASLMLGLQQLLLWRKLRRNKAILWSVAMAFSAAAIAFIEIALMNTMTPGEYGALLVWSNWGASVC